MLPIYYHDSRDYHDRKTNRPHFLPPSLPPPFILRRFPPFIPSSCILPPSTHPRPRVFPSFLRSVLKHRRAILINALTLPLHNYACPRPDSAGSNNTISRVYRELLILGTMSPCSASRRRASIRLDLTAIERLPKQAAVN